MEAELSLPPTRPPSPGTTWCTSKKVIHVLLSLARLFLTSHWKKLGNSADPVVKAEAPRSLAHVNLDNTFIF